MARSTIIVPIKPLPAAKTRLGGAAPERAPPALVLAMAQDTVAAALAGRLVSDVLVVCNDERVTAAMAALGARCVPDLPAIGLNEAIVYGEQHVAGEAAALTA